MPARSGRVPAACYAGGTNAFVSIIDQPYNLAQAIGSTQRLLEAGPNRSRALLRSVGHSRSGRRDLAAGAFEWLS